MATVLVADDKQDMRALMRKRLNRAGHDVLEAVDGKEALRMALEQNPDVLLLDVSMPAMEGPEVLRELRQARATQEMPDIFLSAHPERQARRGGRDQDSGESGAGNSGPTYYITKPWKRGANERAFKNALSNRSPS